MAASSSSPLPPLLEARQRLTFATAYSLPANLIAVLVTLTDALHTRRAATAAGRDDRTEAAPWLTALLAGLSAADRARLHRLDPLLIHGLILLEARVAADPLDDPAIRDWSAYRRELEGRDGEWWRALIARGIHSGLTYYVRHLSPVPAVDAFLARCDGRVPSLERFLAEPGLLADGVRAGLASWRHLDAAESYAYVEDPARLGRDTLAALEGIWQALFAPDWPAKRRQLEGAVARVRALTAPDDDGRRLVDDPDLFLPAVTGLRPPQRLVEQIRESDSICFVPTLYLERHFLVVPHGDRLYLLFSEGAFPAAGVQAPAPTEALGEPDGAGGPDLAWLAAALNALGEPRRLRIIRHLAQCGEQYGQEIVAALDLQQSTVSRDLSRLEEAGLIRVRREGNHRYYRLSRGGSKQMLEGLRASCGGAGPEPGPDGGAT